MDRRVEWVVERAVEWLGGEGRVREVVVSGDRVVVLTETVEYHAWGFLGPAVMMDVETGRVVAELRGDRAVALGGGRFLLGLEGYDVFDTWLHDRDGAVLTNWRSYGHYVPDPDGTVRVVECDRKTPTEARVVRLCAGGEIERGPRLVDGQVPAPVVLGDGGNVVVLDAGVLRVVDRELRAGVIAELFNVAPGEAWRFRGELRLDDGGRRLRVTVEERRKATRTWSVPVRRWSAAAGQPPPTSRDQRPDGR